MFDRGAVWGLVLAMVAAASPPAWTDEKGHQDLPDASPNIVLFVVDDLGWRDLGCMGSDFYRTPNIDRLAAEGTRFTQAYAACAVCSPSRAALLTGQYPARLGLTQWLPAGRWNPRQHRMQEGRFLRQLPLENLTLAELLNDRYHCWHVGKWHLGGAPFSGPEQHGFAVNIGGNEHGAPGSYFHPFRGRWKLPTTEQFVLKETLAEGEPGDYLTDRLTDEAITLIEGADERPFLLFFPFYAVHTPLEAKPELKERYEEIPADQRQGNPAYAAMVESVDQNVGRVLEALERAGAIDRSLIIFTSDNGGYAKATDHAPLRANKGSHYEGGIRVPLVIKGPGVRVGEVCPVPVHAIDLLPTLLEWTGTPIPQWLTLDGLSLGPLLASGETGTELDQRALYWHYPHYNRHPESFPASVVRKGPWKLIENLETGRTELFNLEEDPGERRDLTTAESELAKALLERLQVWREAVRAEPMQPNPAHRGDR